MKSASKLLGGILLVSGTTIGAAMLALPVSTGLAGFYPSLLLFILCWSFMTYTALLMLEVNLSFKHSTNLISMAHSTLGRGGVIFSWITYLFLLYALTTAYIAGSSSIILDSIYVLTEYQLPSWAGIVPLFLIFGYFVYKGTKSVDYVNRLLMIGLVVTYFAIVALVAPHVNVELFTYSNWSFFWSGVSIVATSFGFHIIIPSLTTYFHEDVKQMKNAIIIGSAIPLVVYVVWELLALGVIPLYGPEGLLEGYKHGANGAYLLAVLLKDPWISTIARAFSFFAIITSFLGVALSLTDFLSDGLKIKKTHTGRLLLYCLTFIPPLIFTLFDPRAFLSALEYAGAFGVVSLLGFLPALMVWSGRYYKNYQTTYTAPGGKFALLLAMALSVLIIALEIANKMGLLSTTKSLL